MSVDVLQVIQGLDVRETLMSVSLDLAQVRVLLTVSNYSTIINVTVSQAGQASIVREELTSVPPVLVPMEVSVSQLNLDISVPVLMDSQVLIVTIMVIIIVLWILVITGELVFLTDQDIDVNVLQELQEDIVR